MDFTFLHVGISVRDLEKSTEWYARVFGFECVKRFEKPALEVKGAVLQKGSLQLELLAPYLPGPDAFAGVPGVPDGTLVPRIRRMGSNHFAIVLAGGESGVAALHGKFKSEDLGWASELVDCRFFFCADPDGAMIEVRA